MALPPFVVVVDPGHGGDGRLTTFGATGHNLREKDLVLEMALELEKQLMRYENVVVYLTRRADNDVTFAERAGLASKVKADLLVSLHFNGFHDASANGFETFVWNGSLRAKTLDYQRAIHRSIYGFLAPLGVRNRGKRRANFAMLRLPPCSAVLIEYLFLTNYQDAQIAADVVNRRKMVAATARGIAEIANLEVNEQPSLHTYRVIAASYRELENAKKAAVAIGQKSPSVSPFVVYNAINDKNFWYRVIAGEFDNLEDAKSLVAWLEGKGYSAWVVSDWEDLDFPEALPVPPEDEKPEDIPEDPPAIEGTPIMAAVRASRGQAEKWAKKKGAHPRFVDIAKLYWMYAEKTNFEPTLLYAQAALETGFGNYQGAVPPEYNNWAGIKTVDADGDKPEDHQQFVTANEGVRAHFNHVAAYVGAEPIGEPHDRYYLVKKLSWAGTIKYMEEMSGKWAPSKDYGERVVRLAKEIEVETPPPQPEPKPEPKPEISSEMLEFLNALIEWIKQWFQRR